MAGLGINLALGILYTWSIFKQKGSALRQLPFEFEIKSFRTSAISFSLR